MAETKSLSIFVEKILPHFVVQEHPQFVTFIRKYFEFLEQEKGYYDIIANLEKYSDVDQTIVEFEEYFHQHYASEFPEDKVRESLKIVVKNIRDFYKSKGTEASFEFIFRLLFNTYVNFYYPREDILEASGGNWVVDRYIIPVTQDTDVIDQYKDTDIKGVSSEATAYVEDTAYINSPQEYSLVLVNVDGDFDDGEEITITDGYDKDTSGISDLTVDTYQVEDGEWKGTDGFISSDKYLQDNYYYQQFSYELQTDIPLEDYERIIKDTVHPSGTMVFGKDES